MTKVESLIPATVFMLSGSRDSQTSADVANVSEFQLPDPAGRAGGAFTSAILKVLYRNKRVPRTTRGPVQMSWVEVLDATRSELKRKGYRQTPELTSSRMIDVNETFNIAPANYTGTKRAVLIGINYTGQKGELSGCQNDVKNMKEYLIDALGFSENNITVLMDDANHIQPTRKNILSAFSSLSSKCMPGDVAYVHYSGHGANVRDANGDEDDGYDETLVPVDYYKSGQIRDDEVYEELIGAMRKGVHLTCLMDCCHSGTVLDLPYKYVANGYDGSMGLNNKFDFDRMRKFAIAAGVIGVAMCAMSQSRGDGGCWGCGCFEGAVNCFEDMSARVPLTLKD